MNSDRNKKTSYTIPQGSRAGLTERAGRSGRFRRFGRVLAGVLTLAMLPGMMGILSGCKKRGFGKDTEGKVKVVASIYPVYDFARKIGGDQVAVKMLVPAGTEPHSWEPSTRDMLDLEEADLFIYNGAGIDAWAEDVMDTVQNKNLTVLEASKDVTLLKAGEDHHDEDEHEDGHDDHDHHHGEYDPHVWLSPKNAEKELATIAEALIEKDPDHADVYRANLEKAKKECEELDSAFRERLSAYSGRYIVVAHEAYGYLCEDYGLKQIGIEGVSADQEPDAARMREIIDMVKEYGIRCIFFEELVDPKVAKSIAEETGCETRALSPLDGLTKDDIDAGREYFSVMRDNLQALAASFE